jgi:putative transposase
MTFDVQKHHRRSPRLKGYDYCHAGAYFVTICTTGRECLFGEIQDGQMKMNDVGRMVEQCWLGIPGHFRHADLDAFVIMPNHIHGIIVLAETGEAKNLSLPEPGQIVQSKFHSPSRTIGAIIRGFKIGLTTWCRKNSDLYLIWQRNYFEHIIRDRESFWKIRNYIAGNPGHWAEDCENPAISGSEIEVKESWRI